MKKAESIQMKFDAVKITSAYYFQWWIQRGFALSPIFKYPMKTKQFGLSETKLFHFHGIFKKIQQSEPPHLYTYEPPFQKSWIRP